MRPAPLAILIPVLGRPHRVEPLLESIARSTPEPHRILFITSPGDHAEIAAITAAGYGGSWTDFEGNYAAKINRGVALTTEPMIFTGADDLEFRPGWFEAARGYMTGPVSVVGTQDLCNPKVIVGDHATHFLIGRRYIEECGTIDEPGKVFHEGYPHEYVDNELIETARMRGAYAFADEAVVEHLHPMRGAAPMDATYRRGAKGRRRARRLFEQRRPLWGGA